MRRMRGMWWVGGLALVTAMPGVAQDRDRTTRQMEELQAALARVDMSVETARMRAMEQWMASRSVQSLGTTRARLAEVEARLHAGQVRQNLEAAHEIARVEGLLRARGIRPGVVRALVPEPWIGQDPADSLYRRAREEMNARRYEEAARRFAEIRDRYPGSGYVGDSYYFQALALYRSGGQPRLAQARRLLEELSERHPDATTAEEARALAVRIQSSLARQGDAEAAAAVAQEAAGPCDDEDQAVRVTALSALLQMDAEQAVPILREVLRQRDECSVELRKQAVFMLSRKSDDAETFDMLVDLAVDNPDPDPEVREAAVFWLAQSGRPEALDALLGLLEQPGLDEGMQEQVIFAIARHDSPRALQVLRDFAREASAPADVRGNAIFWLGQRGGTDAVPFLRELWTSLDDPELKDYALSAMARTGGEEGTAWLIARANDPTEPIEVRKQALFWAGQRGGLSVQQALDIYRSSEDREMKEQAIFVLSRQQDDRTAAVDAMMEIARTEEDRELRSDAIFWLGRTDDPRVAEFLLEVIRGGGG